MGLTKLKKGLDLPINGAPEQTVHNCEPVSQVALVGDDYIGMKPTMAVDVGDTVKLGQLLFTDKKMEGVKYTSPGAGKVVAVNRGEKRIFQSIVVELKGNDQVTFDNFKANDLKSLKRDQVQNQLIESGVWTALRARPFGKVANPATTPHSIFVTAMDSNPHAPEASALLEGHEDDFINGLEVISKLTEGKVFVCKSPGDKISTGSVNAEVAEFSGPHPAGLVGTHIHFLDPVNREKTVWHVGLQDVIAIGVLFTTGKIHTERIVSFSGPTVKHPRLLKTRPGALIDELTSGELKEVENRQISGSVLSGRTASGPYAFLGRYHQQIFALEEGRKREFFGWLGAGVNDHSVKNIVLSKLFSGKKFNMTTTTNGSRRAIVPNGGYEQVMPMDIQPTFLLRALAVNDLEEAEKLGALELDEEDLALCTYACPSKRDFGPSLRENLTIIEKEG
ncbi:MAG: Na(+)-translocating NADH-quinone reductase subunit A [Calditrichaeota bacterium]|nr:MAG: Na(+)-translocating NADH-quinone reductase subunit A [Calditrichota bacterium]